MAQSLNFSIHGSTINSSRGDVNIKNIINKNSEPGLYALSLAVSHGAIHDSAERCPPPNCHPDTRKAVRQMIEDWIRSECSASPFFWLYGPAGAGKTAILQAIAESLCRPLESDEDFGGSFFFSRGKNGRDQGHFLFSTVAFQLALNVPGLRQHVNRFMEENPTLHTKSMAVQLQTLIVDSIQCLSPLPQRPHLVIIDGLDECHDKTTQQSILRLLCETIALHKLPLRFLIGSRPECHIRAIFDQKSLCTITRRVVLDEKFNPGKDIQVFLEDGFAKLCVQNSILSHVRQPWPGQGIVDLLVQRSSGQFIYAATVLKFVGADFCSPTKQLALILKPDSTAFSDIDQLYTQILSVYPSTVNIVRLLGMIMAFDEEELTPEVLEDILGMEEGEAKLMLRGLSSLIAFRGDLKGEYLTDKVIKNVGRPDFLHTSFRDFLADSDRSGPFHVDKQKYKNQGIIWSFSVITKSIASSWRTTPTTRVRHNKTWVYFDLYLAKYFMDSPTLVKETIMTDINDLVQEFWMISRAGVLNIPFTSMRHLLEILQILKNFSQDFADLLDGYQKILDQLFIFAFSRDLGDLFRSLPGIAVQNDLSMEGMSELYRLNMDELERLIVSNIDLLSPFNVCPQSRYRLADYLVSFLQDPGRCPLFYFDPASHHISICRQTFSLLDRIGSRSLSFQASYDLNRYIENHLGHHLSTATNISRSIQNVTADHPAIQILDSLECIAYRNVYATQSFVHGYWAQPCLSSILNWGDMSITRLKGVVPISNVDLILIQRLCQLTYKIYREILCLKMDGGTMIVALLGHTFGITSSFYIVGKALRHRALIQLSWELLSFVSKKGGVSPSFSQFITTPEMAGALYISPRVFHTQITEYCLETLYQSENLKPSPFAQSLGCSNTHRGFEKHISQALPTEMIFYLLRSIPSRRFTHDRESAIVDILEIIVGWLEGLGFERPMDLYDRFQSELLLEQELHA